MIIDSYLLPEPESTKSREAVCLGVAAALHALLLLWNPTMLKSDFKPVHDFVSVDIVDQPAPGGEAPAAPKRMSLMDTLKDMLLKPKEDEIAHVAPEPPANRVAAPMQPALQEKQMPRPLAAQTFQPQSQSEDLAQASPKAIDVGTRNIAPLPGAQPQLKAKAFGGIRAKDLPFQVGTDAGIASGGSASIPIAVGNTSAKDALAYQGPALKDSGHAPVSLNSRSFHGATGDVATLGAGSSANIALSGTGGTGNAPTGATSGSVLQNRAGSGSGGGLVNRAIFGNGRGGGIGNGIEGIPSAAQEMDTQISNSAKSGASGRTTKKAFEIAGPLNNRTIVKKVIPEYPAWAEEQGIIGSVRLYFTVTPEGMVRNDIRVTKTTGYPQLDQLGIDALKQWQFAPKPSSDEGKGEWGIITFNFSLSS